MATKKVFPVRLDEVQHKTLEQAADAEGKSKHQFVLDAIEHEANKSEIKKLITKAYSVLISGDDPGGLRDELFNWIIENN
jgi:hypothetical protein